MVFKNNRPTTVKGAFRRMLPFMSQFVDSNVSVVEDSGGRRVYRAFAKTVVYDLGFAKEVTKFYEFEKNERGFFCWDVTDAESRFVVESEDIALLNVHRHYNKKMRQKRCEK